MITAEHMGDVQFTDQCRDDDYDIDLSMDRSFSSAMGKFLSIRLQSVDPHCS